MSRPEVWLRRFMANVVEEETCWIWQGRTNQGYGVYSGSVAHREAYKHIRGPIPEGLELDHLCRRPACVNPEHLEPVTRAENARRRSEAKTHCKNDHEFTPENTRFYTDRGWNVRRLPCVRRSEDTQLPSPSIREGDPMTPDIIAALFLAWVALSMLTVGCWGVARSGMRGRG